MIINKLNMDLSRCPIAPAIDAVQGDTCSRTLEISLFSDQKPFLLPENLAVLVRYKKADRKGGEYDTLPDGSAAWSAQGNRLKIILAPQVLTCPGEVLMTVAMISGGKLLNTFPLRISVQPSAQPSLADSEDYFRITGFVTAPGNARIGQFLQVASVDASGKVTGVAATDVVIPESDIPQPDWNAAEDQPGHVKNRTHWTDRSYGEISLPEILWDDEDGDGIADYGVIAASLGLLADEVYTVTWKGTDYAATGMDLSVLSGGEISGVMIGNTAVIGGEDNGIPFLIVDFGPDFNLASYFGQVLPVSGSVDTNFTLKGPSEVVHPLPAKYLSNVRGQRKIRVDLDSGDADISIEKAMEMDIAELQAAVIVIYEGVEHAAVISERATVNYEGTDCPEIRIWFTHYDSNDRPKIVAFKWNEYYGLLGTNLYKYEFVEQYNGSYAAAYVMMPGNTSSGWEYISSIIHDSIVLKSTTSGSSKRFRITVDDSGTLTATAL